MRARDFHHRLPQHRQPPRLRGLRAAEVPLARRAPDHEHFQPEAAGEKFPDRAERTAHPRGRGGGEILIHEKERLHPAQSTLAILDAQPVALEVQRPADDVVVARVFREMPKRITPRGVRAQLGKRRHADAAGGGFENSGRWHRKRAASDSRD